MKLKSLIHTVILLLLMVGTSENIFAQKEQNIISNDVRISKYHDRDELLSVNKGDLLKLYIQRVDVLIKMLPNLAFTTKPGVTMSDVGIPDTKEHRKALGDNIEATASYFEDSAQFQNLVLPYSDKSNLIRAILFYEQTIKSLHTYNDFD